MRIERGRIEERDLRFEGEIEIREGKRIEEWDGNRSKGIAQHSSQNSNLSPQTLNLKP